MRALEFLAGVVLAAFLAVTASAQDLPAEVMDNYAAFQAAAAEDDWSTAAFAIERAAEAGDRLQIDAASRMVLWENTGVAWGRVPDPEQAISALERAVEISEAQTDSAVTVRLLFRLVQQDVAAGDGASAMNRAGAFERAVLASGEAHPVYERQVLTILLAGTAPTGPYTSRRMTDVDQRRVARLEQLSEPGDFGSTTAARWRIWNEINQDNWQGALDATVAALRALPGTGDHLPDAREQLHDAYGVIIDEGFGDHGTSGVTHLPQDLQPGWCAHLTEHLSVYERVDPVYSGMMAENGEEGSVYFDVTINARGELVEMTRKNPDGSRAENRRFRAAEDAMREWRFRPQCEISDDFLLTDDVEFHFTLID